MWFLSNCCHIFRRLGARAGWVAAGVPGCGGGAEGPVSKQISCLPARSAGGKKSHGAGGRQRSRGLRLQWVTVIKIILANCTKCGGKERHYLVHHLLASEVVWKPHGCRLSPFISPNNCSLTLLICMKLVVQEDTSLYTSMKVAVLLMTIAVYWNELQLWITHLL